MSCPFGVWGIRRGWDYLGLKRVQLFRGGTWMLFSNNSANLDEEGTFWLILRLMALIIPN